MARILIVEDVHFIAKVLASYFESRGHDVVMVEDGRKALDEVRAKPPELMLSDISMPGLDGLQVARQVKSDPATAVVPILMLTARSDEDAMQAAIEAGVDEYMVKPFDAERLLQKATKLLGGFPMNYALAMHGHVAVLRALPADWNREAVGQLRSALAATARHAKGPIVLDLSNVKKLENAGVDDAMLVLLEAAGERKVSVVAPERALGMRALREKLGAMAGWHADLASALAPHGVTGDSEGKPVRLATPSRTEARTAST